MIDEQYIAKIISMMYLCKMLLSLKTHTHDPARHQFEEDFRIATEFLMWVDNVLPVFHQLDELGEIYARMGKTVPLEGEHKTTALLRWLRVQADSDDEGPTYH